MIDAMKDASTIRHDIILPPRHLFLVFAKLAFAHFALTF